MMPSIPDEMNVAGLALQFLNQTQRSVFLTGKAGTGKTTFLQAAQKETIKNCIVVAPTGVAAINAGGVTIHSFFQLPLAPFLPTMSSGWGNGELMDKQSLLAKVRISKEKAEMMNSLELLIIDEISMVRCDVMDAMDTLLRHVRRKYHLPFGGVQVLFIGDLFQLPPVVREEDWSLIRSAYDGPFFFHSKVYAELQPVYIELEKVYRQQDERFINLLNKVRNNNMDTEAFALLQTRFDPNITHNADDGLVTLTTHNRSADAINQTALAKLAGEQKCFNAAITGDFNEASYPADAELLLKTGAQVMFIRNDSEKIRRYYNGKIGRVEKMEDDKIWVACGTNNDRQLIEVRLETWRNIRYNLNPQSKQIEEQELGSFSQFPLRLAWAITIHKSQGLTFDRLLIDAGQSFAAGQVYVALSRCTSLEGIRLKSRIGFQNLFSDERIVQFISKQKNNQFLQEELNSSSILFQQETISRCFDFNACSTLFAEAEKEIRSHLLQGETTLLWMDDLQNAIAVCNQHGQSFMKELSAHFQPDKQVSDDPHIQDRVIKAAGWFYDAGFKIKTRIAECPVVTDNLQTARTLNHKLDELYQQVCSLLHIFSHLKSGYNLQKFLESKKRFSSEPFPVNTFSGNSSYVPSAAANPLLYRELADKRNEIAKEKNCPVYLVCSTQALEQMALYLPATTNELKKLSGFGDIKVRQYGQIFIDIITTYCHRFGLETNMQAVQNEVKKVRNKDISGDKKPKKDTKLETFKLISNGKSISEAAKERQLAASTIEGHVAHYIESGELAIDQFIDQEKKQQIRKAILEQPDKLSLGLIREKIPGLSYGEIKMVLADMAFKKDLIAQ